LTKSDEESGDEEAVGLSPTETADLQDVLELYASLCEPETQSRDVAGYFDWLRVITQLLVIKHSKPVVI